MIAAQRKLDVRTDGLVERLASLERAGARRRKLQALFNDSSFLDKALEQGRYLRLCAAIAWASEREEHVRRSIETDLMVEELRQAMTSLGGRSAFGSELGPEGGAAR